MNMNQLDPALVQQAQLLGQRRTPTKAEMREMEKSQIMAATLQVGGTALGSFLEAGGDLQRSATYSQAIAKAILDKSEETKGDFEDDIRLRKARNQLAAQLVYSKARGDGIEVCLQTPPNKLVEECFVVAATMIRDADAFAEKEVSREKDNSSPLLAP